MSFYSRLFLLVAGWSRICLSQATTGSPLVIAPSGAWDGADGPWSTFNLGVGDPVQPFRVVPGISSPLVILPIQSDWCNETCEAQTTILHKDQSTTWQDAGLFSIPPSISDNDETSGVQSGIWGVDRVYLGPSARDIATSLQYVVGVTLKKFYIGTFGLSVGQVGPFGNTKPGFLQGLRDASVIPSLSFSYTAGSVNKNTSGSLVLGGYDTSRFDRSTTLSWPLPNAINDTLIVSTAAPNSSLTVELTAITIFGTNQTIWVPESTNPNSLSFAIESAVPHIWLPLSACQMFETAFGLTWDETLELYLVDNETHTRLLNESREVRFTLSNGEKATSYTLPYSAFDLTLGFPFVNTSMRYFPIKRARDSMGYMLGRTFLQEMYVTVDYERGNFSLSQALPDGGSAYIVPIVPRDPTSASKSSRRLSSAAYAGIGVGVGTVALIAVGMFIAWRLRWREKDGDSGVDIMKAELHGDHGSRVEAMGKERMELDAASSTCTYEAMEKERSELEAADYAAEMEGSEYLTGAQAPGIDLLHELPCSNNSEKNTL